MGIQLDMQEDGRKKEQLLKLRKRKNEKNGCFSFFVIV